MSMYISFMKFWFALEFRPFSEFFKFLLYSIPFLNFV